LRYACEGDLHPTTNERVVCSSELPDDVRAERAWLAEDGLHVVWSHDQRESVYELSWLEAHAYARGRDRSAPTPPPSDVRAFEIDAAALDDGASVARAVELVARHGAAIVRSGTAARREPEHQTERLIDAFVAQGLRVVGTHFGRIEDLRTDNTTNQNTDQLGYTDAAIELHTDQPFLDHPPRYQLLQSIRAAEVGGENAIVDGLAAAELLKAEDHVAYEILRRTPVTFHRKQKAFERSVTSPIFVGSREGGFQIRYSYFTLAPHRLPFDEMEGFYRAYDRFARLVRDPQNQLRFLLRPGDYLLYDNHRMLHARTAFRGARWVRGIYFDRAEEGGAL
jgi:gamma-butyrobetaine dioxygenase/trimethyllysine dioxygenase